MFPVDPATEGGTFFESKYENSQKVATSTPKIIGFLRFDEKVLTLGSNFPNGKLKLDQFTTISLYPFDQIFSIERARAPGNLGPQIGHPASTHGTRVLKDLASGIIRPIS